MASSKQINLIGFLQGKLGITRLTEDEEFKKEFAGSKWVGWSPSMWENWQATRVIDYLKKRVGDNNG